MTDIPEEKFITKRQLWERSDAHYAAYQSQLQEAYDRIAGIENTIASEVAGIISKDKVEMEKNRMNLNDSFQSSKKDLEKIINDAVTRMQQAMNTHISKMDKKISELTILIEDKTDRKITDRLQSIAGEAKLIYETVSSYKVDTERQINKFQTDTAQKIGLLDKKVTAVMGRFKKISSELS